MKIFVLLYVIAIILIAEKDRRQRNIDRKILVYGMSVSMLNMIYMYIKEPDSIYASAIYLGIYVILLTIDTILLKKYANDSYNIKIIMLLNIIFAITKWKITIYTIVMAFIAILIYVAILQLNKKKNGNVKIKFNEIPIGFFIGGSNIITLIMIAVINNM